MLDKIRHARLYKLVPSELIFLCSIETENVGHRGSNRHIQAQIEGIWFLGTNVTGSDASQTEFSIEN